MNSLAKNQHTSKQVKKITTATTKGKKEENQSEQS